MVDIMCW